MQITIWLTAGVWYFPSLIVLFRWSTDADDVIADEKESDDVRIISIDVIFDTKFLLMKFFHL